MSKARHWERVHSREPPQERGWYQTDPKMSLELMREHGVQPEHRMIDAGGGTSYLVDRLLDLSFRDITVLDLSRAALLESQKRLGDRYSVQCYRGHEWR